MCSDKVENGIKSDKSDSFMGFDDLKIGKLGTFTDFKDSKIGTFGTFA